MAKPSQEKRASRWTERLSAANKLYDRWEKEFDCERLQNYYKGKQWRGMSEEDAQTKYVINLIFPTIETATPSLMFYRPQVKVEPRPAHADDANSDAGGRAELLEDTLQTFVDDPKIHFKQQTLLALKEAWFRYGVVEVGYTADWIDNPNAGKPMLKENSQDPLLDGDNKEILQPSKVTKAESLYVKRIPASHFRCSVSNANQLEENDWYAYYEWEYVEDLKRNPRYKNTAELETGGTVTDMPKPKADDTENHAGMVKVWKIWDLRQKVKHVIADGAKSFLLENDPAKYGPHAVLKFYELLDQFYPLPPVSNWLSPQDELNETREMQKVHRRRFTRRYTYFNGSVDEPELEKLETGEDGVYAKRNMANAADCIVAVPDAPLGAENTVMEVQQTMQDFSTIAGVSGESNQTNQADTATQANIMNTKQMVRESQSRALVADWLAQICRLMALTIRDKMQLPFMVQVNTDPYSADPVAMPRTAMQWKEVTAEDLGDLDLDVKVDMATLSPVSEDQQRLAWNQVLAILMNPAALQILMQPNPMSPTEPSPLLRKTLGFYGIKSDQEVREIARVGQEALQQFMMMQMAQMMGGGKAGASGGAGATSTAGAPGQAPTGIPDGGPTVQ